MIVGRTNELKELHSLLTAEESQFVAVYGRRRVGKTFLIREAFDYKFTFQHTGLYNASMREQLSEFRESLYAAGMQKVAMPKSWNEAFRLLARLIEEKPEEGKKLIFIDEMPWMDTPKSNFVSALDHFWNGWATTRRDIILIICGSATSWIIENVIMNYGGLHNRLTNQIPVAPFTLKECREYCKSKGLGYTNRQILEAYMAVGGIPYYWSFMERGKSVAQNFDTLFFSKYGKLSHEFDALYASLFKKPKSHIAIITALARKKMGMLREDILKTAKLHDNAEFSKALRELEQCGFIRRFTTIGKRTKGMVYQLMDNYTLFYFDFISENTNEDEHFWTSHLESTLHNGWAGRAFERVCLQHLQQIKQGLGIASVITNAHAWIADGAQVDLLIDRNDQTINLCEMKYAKASYYLSAEEASKLQNRKAALIRETETTKSVLLTMITTYGLTKGGHADDIHCQLTMDDLFQ